MNRSVREEDTKVIMRELTKLREKGGRKEVSEQRTVKTRTPA